MLLKPQRLVQRAGLRYSRVYKIGSPIIVLLSALIASLSHSVEANTRVVRKPFRVLWNIPDYQCSGLYYKSVINIGIEANTVGQFVGDRIATLYEPGFWPKIEGDHRINGGIPQLANFTAHLIALRNLILRLISENSTGYGVLDQELWRVPYDLNYSGFNKYRWASVNWFQPKKVWSEAKKEWETSAGYVLIVSAFLNRELMVRSLETAKAARPNVKWGYYLYPQTWWSPEGSKIYNDEMSEIYRTSTGLYPSIYINNPELSYKDIHKRIQDTLSEAIRVRHVHSHHHVPIIVYTAFNSGIKRLFNESILDLAIRLPAEMGTDGVVLWGSSQMFRPDSAASCKIIGKYVEETLGPYISNLLKELTECSKIKCNGNGKCVKTEYAEKVPYIRRTCAYDDTDSETYYTQIGHSDNNKANETTSAVSDPQDKYVNYECQCYCEYFFHE